MNSNKDRSVIEKYYRDQAAQGANSNESQSGFSYGPGTTRESYINDAVSKNMATWDKNSGPTYDETKQQMVNGSLHDLSASTQQLLAPPSQAPIDGLRAAAPSYGNDGGLIAQGTPDTQASPFQPQQGPSIADKQAQATNTPPAVPNQFSPPPPTEAPPSPDTPPPPQAGGTSGNLWHSGFRDSSADSVSNLQGQIPGAPGLAPSALQGLKAAKPTGLLY